MFQFISWHHYSTYISVSQVQFEKRSIQFQPGRLQTRVSEILNRCDHRVNTELSLDSKIDSFFWVSNGDIGIVFYWNIYDWYLQNCRQNLALEDGRVKTLSVSLLYGCDPVIIFQRRSFLFPLSILYFRLHHLHQGWMHLIWEEESFQNISFTSQEAAL